MPKSEIIAEEYNCNIRRYVDNAPPPEPHDVRAHLHGGIPRVEVESLAQFWQNYGQLGEDAFVPRDDTYLDLAPVLTAKRDIADFVATHQSVTTCHKQFIQTLEAWWQANLPIVEALAPDAANQEAHPRNVYVMRSSLLSSIEQALAGQQLLTSFQVRGAFANYVEVLKADFKSIAASGWGAELIPDEDILQSQFPEVLEQLQQAQTRLAELQALFAAADEEEFEDSEETGVLMSEEVKGKKEELKALMGMWKEQLKLVKNLAGDIFTELKAADLLSKGESKGFYCTEGFNQKDPQFDNGQRVLDLAFRVGHITGYAIPLKEAMERGQRAYERTAVIEVGLARHKALEDEVRILRADIKGIENNQDELVQSARAKISTDEARQVIIGRLRQTLMDIYETYLRADQRACIRAIEKLWGKYAVTAKEIEAERDAASKQLQEFLVELGYE